ncbi:hypothetical protein CVT24_012666, partial [Panaeolus cyanescens]
WPDFVDIIFRLIVNSAIGFYNLKERNAGKEGKALSDPSQRSSVGANDPPTSYPVKVFQAAPTSGSLPEPRVQ